MSYQRPVKTNVAVKAGENEVERSRDMGDWRKVLELLEAGRAGKQVSSGPGDILANFLQSEAKLELWLEECQAIEKTTKAKSALVDVKKGLQLVLSHAGDQSGLKTDVRVLLAKVYYTSGLYEEAVDELDKSGIMGVSETGQSIRNIQLMAESHAIRAQSLEKVGKSLRSLSEADRKKEVLRCYNRSADLALQFFQAQEKLFGQVFPPSSSGNVFIFPNVNITLNNNPNSISPSPSGGTTSPHPQNWEKRRPPLLLHNAIRRGPALLIEDGKLDEAITRIEKLCRTHDTHYFTPIRLGFYRLLAELLLRYKFISTSKLTSLETSGTHIKFHSSPGLFTPQNIWEYILLTVLLGESLVVKEGVLNQAPEFEKARKLVNANAAAVYDLFCLAAARWSQYRLINEGFEQALKFSFEEPHIWSQYALTFVAAGCSTRKSYQTLVEAATLSSKPTSLLLLAAQQAFRQVMTEEGLQIVQKAKTKELEGPQKFFSRVLLYEGIGYFLVSFEKHMNQQRLNDRQLALSSLQKSAEMDPLDHLTLHWLARVYAWTGNTDDAFNVAVKALRIYPFHLPTLQLIILLLTAQRNYSDALAVTEEALDEYPDHLGFLQMKAALDEKLFGPEAALQTVRQMMVVWKGLFEDGFGHLRGDSPENKSTFGGGGGGGYGNLQLPSPPVERDGGSVASFRAASVAGSSTNTGTLTVGFRADAALSEIASSVSMNGISGQLNTGELVWTAQINIWIMLTDLYLKLNQPTQATLSVEEAGQIAAAHPDVLYFRGQIEEHQGNYVEARRWYESAVGVRPTHVKALQSLALMQHYFGSHRLAEKTLQDALKLDPYDHHTWYNLGKVLEALNECSEAADCMATALKIEAMNPTLPYSIIPVCFE